MSYTYFITVTSIQTIYYLNHIKIGPALRKSLISGKVLQTHSSVMFVI